MGFYLETNALFHASKGKLMYTYMSSKIEVAMVCQVNRRCLFGWFSCHIYVKLSVISQSKGNLRCYLSRVTLIIIWADQAHNYAIMIDRSIPDLRIPSVSPAMKTVFAQVLGYMITLTIDDKSCFANTIGDTSDGGTEIWINRRLISWKM